MNKCVKYQELVVQITYVDEMLIAGPADLIVTEQRNAKGTVTNLKTIQKRWEKTVNVTEL